jgi:hypothetical protein
MIERHNGSIFDDSSTIPVIPADNTEIRYASVRKLIATRNSGFILAFRHCCTYRFDKSLPWIATDGQIATISCGRSHYHHDKQKASACLSALSQHIKIIERVTGITFSSFSVPSTIIDEPLTHVPDGVLVKIHDK